MCDYDNYMQNILHICSKGANSSEADNTVHSLFWRPFKEVYSTVHIALYILFNQLSANK